MDLIKRITQEEKKAALLTLPRRDLPLGKQPQKEEDASKAARFVLMQLPKGIEAKDLVQGSRFVAPPVAAENEVEAKKKTQDNSSYKPADRVALVVESKKESFFINRLETSNVLMLVSPDQPQQRQSMAVEDASKENTNTTSNTNPKDGEEPASKKAKTTATSTCTRTSTTKKPPLVPVSARLLTPGAASGSSFLELRARTITSKQVAPLLASHVYDPYQDSHWEGKKKSRQNVNPYQKSKSKSTSSSTTTTQEGRTVESLALQLQCTTGQIMDALVDLRSFPFPPNSKDDSDNNNNDSPHDECCYGILSEEALQDALTAMIATLAEEFDQFGDYDKPDKGVDVGDFLRCVMARIPEEESYPTLEHVLRYAMTHLLTTTKDTNALLMVKDEATPRVTLDVQKIAICIAHRLFQKKRVWDEDAFMLKWQSDMPGVGRRYTVQLDMLRGVAIMVVNDNLNDNDNSPQQRKWRYLPHQSLPLEPTKRFSALFAARSKWDLDDLEPYLEAMVKDLGISQAELLLQYASSTVDEEGIRMYHAKE